MKEREAGADGLKEIFECLANDLERVKSERRFLCILKGREREIH